MKSYNVNNYIRYKEDLDASIKAIPHNEWRDYTRDQMIVKFMPLVENLAKKFSTLQQASGVMDINDLIQEGCVGLVQAVDKIDWQTIEEAEDKEQRLKSFLAKRIRGAIRRAIDINRGTMRIPEHKLNQIRKEFDENKEMVALFFNSVFASLDNEDEESTILQIPNPVDEYDREMLAAHIKGLMLRYLNHKEFQVIRLSYGLDCDKMSANEIADVIGLKGSSSYVRISQLKKQAIDKLIENVPHSQVVDYL